MELDRGKLTLFSGDVDLYLEHQQERREHDQRVNAATLSKRRQLETFIAKNRANANTASQARSKAKQLERLQLIEIEGAADTVRIALPEVEARQGTALRCSDLTIGYSNAEVASDINVEVVHGTRTAVVGDNGQGKTTFLRSITDSLPTLAGTVKWGFGCQLGEYAQHVYTGLPEEDSIQEYLERAAATGTRPQAILNMAGCFLFRGEDVKKKIRVLSGGERARLCLAGLLLGGHNVLILDEPGNHLDVETVEALADALNEFRGTVVFTSHDRHFMQRVATHVIEVRDGSVVEYQGDYEHYLYRVRKEISDGARVRAQARPSQHQKGGPTKSERKEKARRRHQLTKEIRSLERQIEKHEQRKREFEAQLLTAVEQAEVRRIRAALEAVEEKLQPIEQRWIELQESLDSD